MKIDKNLDGEACIVSSEQKLPRSLQDMLLQVQFDVSCLGLYTSSEINSSSSDNDEDRNEQRGRNHHLVPVSDIVLAFETIAPVISTALTSPLKPGFESIGNTRRTTTTSATVSNTRQNHYQKPHRLHQGDQQRDQQRICGENTNGRLPLSSTTRYQVGDAILAPTNKPPNTNSSSLSSFSDIVSNPKYSGYQRHEVPSSTTGGCASTTYTVSTKVRKKMSFHHDKSLSVPIWIEGKITEIDYVNQQYHVKYWNNKSETIALSDPQIHVMVRHAKQTLPLMQQKQKGISPMTPRPSSPSTLPQEDPKSKGGIPLFGVSTATAATITTGKTNPKKRLRFAESVETKTNNSSNGRQLGNSHNNYNKESIGTPLQKEKKRKVVNSNANGSSRSDAPRTGLLVSSLRREGPPGLLTNEQRINLRGIKFNVNDFEKFLIDEEKLAAKTVAATLKTVKSLDGHSTRDSINGGLSCGVTCSRWPVGVVFYPPNGPIVDMSCDFYQLRQDAIIHEGIYGCEGDNLGRRTLVHPIQKLEKYQVYFFLQYSLKKESEKMKGLD